LRRGFFALKRPDETTDADETLAKLKLMRPSAHIRTRAHVHARTRARTRARTHARARAHVHVHAHVRSRAHSCANARECSRSRAREHARSLATLLLLAPALWLASCATPSRPTTDAAPAADPVARNQTKLAAAPEKDKTLWQYRLAASALHQDRPEIAKPALDAALATATANYGAPNAAAAKSRHFLGLEASKPFIGEPYERVMANYYRALLYWADGDLGNARALLRTAQLLDSDTVDKTYANDYVLLDYLDGLLTAKLTPRDPAAGAAALARARASTAAQNQLRLPDYEPAANVFIFVEYGEGPLKCPGGDNGEKLAYFLPANSCQSAGLSIGGQFIKLAPYDDIGFQAMTRGGRVMDKILARKNSVEKPIKAVGNGLTKTGAAIATSDAWIKDAKDIKSAIGGAIIQYGLAATFMVASAPFHIVSSVITKKSQADTRCWNNLPRYLSFAALKLPPGAHEARLDFYDPLGRLYFSLTQRFTITVPDPDPAALPPGARTKDIVILRSQLRN